MNDKIQAEQLIECKFWFLLNEGASFELHISGFDVIECSRLKETLADGVESGSTRDTVRLVLPFILRAGFRCREIDDYVNDFKNKYEEALETEKVKSNWTSATQEEQAEMLFDLEYEAEQSLYVRPYTGALGLLNHSSCEKVNECLDNLSRRYGGIALKDWFTFIDTHQPGTTHVVRAGTINENRFRRLINVGLAAMDKNPDFPIYLKSLRLKDLNQILAENQKMPCKRKADAVKTVLTLKDVQSITANWLAELDFYTILQLHQDLVTSDLNEVRQEFAYREVLANLLVQTYTAAYYETRNARQEENCPFIKEWEVLSVNDDRNCQCCAKRAGTRKKTRPKTPFHLGCRCTVVPVISARTRLGV